VLSGAKGASWAKAGTVNKAPNKAIAAIPFKDVERFIVISLVVVLV
jgi:hypothetical protein